MCFQKNNNKGKQGGYEQDAEYVWYWKDTDESKKEMPPEHQGTGIGFGANGWFVAKEGGEGLRAEQRRVCYGFRTRVVGRRREVGS